MILGSREYSKPAGVAREDVCPPFLHFLLVLLGLCLLLAF